MHILVTGAGGFVGSRLVLDLARHGHQVTGTWLNNRSRLSVDLPNGVTLVQIDLTDAAAVREVFRANEIDVVVNCAAKIHIDDDTTLADVVSSNVLSQATLLDAALATSCLRFIFCSTISVYGNLGAPQDGYREQAASPDSIYGWSKRAAEEVLELAGGAQGLRALSLRLAGIHGVGRETGALAAMTRAAIAGKPLNVNEPRSLFRWLFIDDLIDAVRAAITADLPHGHSIANLASLDTFTMSDLANRILEVTSSNSPIELGAPKIKRNEVMNIDAAQTFFDYTPRSLEHHLHNFVAAITSRK